MGEGLKRLRGLVVPVRRQRLARFRAAYQFPRDDFPLVGLAPLNPVALRSPFIHASRKSLFHLESPKSCRFSQ